MNAVNKVLNQTDFGRISTIDLSYENQLVKNAFMQRFSETFDANQLQAGPQLAELENSISEVCGTQFTSLTGSGTMALQAAAAALGIQPGDEVIVPANTFVASAMAFHHVGAKIVLADVDPNSFVLTRSSVARVMSEKTRCILPVHLYGRVVDLDQFKDFEVPIVEDAAHAFGGKLRGNPVGSLGNLAAFSTAPIKSFGSVGHSGLITYNSQAHREIIEPYINNGQIQRHIADIPGHNFRMDNICALFLQEKLKVWPKLFERRKAIKAVYDERFSANDIAIQEQHAESDPSLWVYVLKVDASKRDQLLEKLTERNIHCLVQYVDTINRMPAWPSMSAREAQVPVAESLSQKILSLPLHPGMTVASAQYVADSVIDCLRA